MLGGAALFASPFELARHNAVSDPVITAALSTWYSLFLAIAALHCFFCIRVD